MYAAEPNIGIHEVLHGRIERSRSFGAQFEVFTGCVSNEGSEDVSFSVVPDKVGWSSLIPRRSVDNAEELLVQTLTMDSWVRKEDHPKVRFIKVDCEGAELKVLQGANAILAHHHAIVHLEGHLILEAVHRLVQVPDRLPLVRARAYNATVPDVP